VGGGSLGIPVAVGFYFDLGTRLGNLEKAVSTGAGGGRPPIPDGYQGMQ